MELRDYQIKALEDIYTAWDEGAQNVVIQLATGGGKTCIFTEIVRRHQGRAMVIAHRVELVSQASLNLARQGVRHNIIGQRQVIREIVSLHMTETGRSYYDPHSQIAVAGVDTLLRSPEQSWYSQVTLIIQDEAHHVLKDNKWGTAASLFPNARGLYPTATPVRADGRGLGRGADGIGDVLIIGPSMRELINRGYLTDYRVFAPPSDLDLASVSISLGGDYSPPKLREATHKSHIHGDVVSHYQRISPGKLGVTFAVDIEAAGEIARNFKTAGISAEVISSKTPDTLRASIMRRFRNKEILQIVNVDILGEGVDCPAIEVVSFARATQSYALYAQQFGRSLRPLNGKSHAIIIDHVGNVMRHGLPDKPRLWSLDRRERRGRVAVLGVIPLRNCLNPECLAVYERIYKACPSCGYVHILAARSTPEQVDGDLLELDREVLAALRGEIDRIDSAPRIPTHLDQIARLAVRKHHHERQKSLHELQKAIAEWAGYWREQGDSDDIIYRRFYFIFGIDIVTAQTLRTTESKELLQKLLTVTSTHGTIDP